MNNVYFTPIQAQFNPLPSFTISPTRITQFFTGGEIKASAELVSTVVQGLGLGAFGLSYALSPNALLPLVSLRTAVSIFRGDSASFLTSVILIGLSVKYAQDGTLTKLSNDLHTFSKEAEGVAEKLDKGQLKEVSLIEAPLLEENPDQIGCIRALIRYINSIIIRIFRAFSVDSLDR